MNMQQPMQPMQQYGGCFGLQRAGLEGTSCLCVASLGVRADIRGMSSGLLGQTIALCFLHLGGLMLTTALDRKSTDYCFESDT